MLKEREEYQDAKVVKAMQMTGIFKNVLDKIRSKPENIKLPQLSHDQKSLKT